MKKIAFLSVALLFALVSASGQGQKAEKKAERVALKKLEGSTVSIVAKNHFSGDFATAKNVTWQRVNTFDEAKFTLDGKEMKAFYDSEGILVGTLETKALKDLPARAQEGLKSKYKDYSVTRVLFFDDNQANQTDMLLYGTQIDDADNYFVELAKGTEKIVVRVDTAGGIFYLAKI